MASIGVWGNGRLPQLYIPSALAVARARVLIFYLWIGIFVIAFFGGLMHFLPIVLKLDVCMLMLM
ncbi:MAG: hypothetical protein Q8S44_08985 [Flavobacteriaceae bacterium]|nr:hypothetical protein [Flavobacteriaceae bacterium]